MNIRKIIFTVTCALLPLCGAMAQSYPTKPIRIISPFQPGGSVASEYLGAHFKSEVQKWARVIKERGMRAA